jgi:hypothetical protein
VPWTTIGLTPVPPLTTAVNCWVWPPDSDAVIGPTETLTATRLMVALAELLL